MTSALARRYPAKGVAALMTACALTAGLGTVDVFANVLPEAEIAAEAPLAEPEATESVPEILVPAGDTTDPVPDESMPDAIPEGDPLTPDGNMTLVDDVGSSTGRGKQFITMVTKNGTISMSSSTGMTTGRRTSIS